MLGSGTAGGADEGRLATRKPTKKISSLGLPPLRDDDDRKLESRNQPPPRSPRTEEPLLFAKSNELSSHSKTFPPRPITP
jgi:hypothetical protein